MRWIAKGKVWGLALLAMTSSAFAQENLDKGKTAQQIFASDCSICHKSPQGLAKSGGLFGLQGFLSEHYMASRQTADLMARYLETAGGGEPAPADQKRQPRRGAKPSDAKPADAKPADAKPADEPSADDGDAKPAPRKKSAATKKPAGNEAKPAAAPEDAPKADAKSEPKAEAKPEVKPEPKAEAPKAESKPDTKDSGEIKSGIAVSPAPADKPKSE